ncbi:exported hypothetical protein [Burkholderiales bacterium]|nr:exported hypothetical protein [Burkholderiales bacterium]
MTLTANAPLQRLLSSAGPSNRNRIGLLAGLTGVFNPCNAKSPARRGFLFGTVGLA